MCFRGSASLREHLLHKYAQLILGHFNHKSAKGGSMQLNGQLTDEISDSDTERYRNFVAESLKATGRCKIPELPPKKPDNEVRVSRAMNALKELPT